MNSKEIFNLIRQGNVKIINQEYNKIQKRSHDYFLGNEMLQNDLESNLAFKEWIDKVAQELFNYLERNRILKSMIKNSIGISESELERRRNLIPSPIHYQTNALLEVMISYYYFAYQDFQNEEKLNSFCLRALKYRYISNIRKTELNVTARQIENLIAKIHIETLNMKQLWKFYQENISNQEIKNLIISGLVNSLWRENECYIEQYLQCVEILNKQMNKMIGGL